MERIRKYLAAICQMDSQDDKEKNLAAAAEMTAEAAARGAKLVVFPENMAFAGRGYRYQAEDLSGRIVEQFRQLAKQHGVWIVTGTFPMAEGSGSRNSQGNGEPEIAQTSGHAESERVSDYAEGARASASGQSGQKQIDRAAIQAGDNRETRVRVNPENTLALIDPTGRLVCTYSKLHMFDVEVENGPSFRESAGNTAGDEIVLADTELGRLGFSVCYDLRFGEMYRLMALHGAQVLLVPSNFTMATGKDHWEPLLRARAIENGVYVIAPNQIGTKNGIASYGKSMVIDPWGDVIARSGDQPGVTLAEIDLDYLERVRRQIPSLENRRGDIYRIESDRIRIYE